MDRDGTIWGRERENAKETEEGGCRDREKQGDGGVPWFGETHWGNQGLFCGKRQVGRTVEKGRES